jgi:sugar O-acyltransferase (sialic acid O-acetyltransferase NeuD family)
LKTNKKIAVIGSVGTALNILYQIKDAIEKYSFPAEIAGIIIDDHKPGEITGDYKVIGSTKDISRLLITTDLVFIFSLYRMEKMKERFELLESYKIPDERFTNFVHPLSYVSPDFKIGKGNVILSNSTVQAGVKLGNFNIINSNISIEHNTVIGDGNFISANACVGAKVTIGNHCFIGLNSSIKENVILDDNVFVGMHSLVLGDFSNVRVAGVPAKILIQKGK